MGAYNMPGIAHKYFYIAFHYPSMVEYSSARPKKLQPDNLNQEYD